MPTDTALDAAEAEHAERVRTYLRQMIEREAGWISFERFMDAALYAPGLGYYSAGAAKFGPAGDFTTAPESSPLFGACVARQCAEVLAVVADGWILEVGAGSGRLAVDILRRLDELGQRPQRYAILEVSADLRERQRRAIESEIPHLIGLVRWLDAPPTEAFNGVIVANEVLDALPVSRFRWSRGACEELGVALAGGDFTWVAHAAPEALARRIAALNGGGELAWDDGYVSECCPRLAPFTRAIVSTMSRGAVLWCDYGMPRAQYYLAERHEGTLICHRRQRVNDDPLSLPGLQDITAWVDFTALAEASLVAGFELAGYTTQTYFLAALGIDAEMQRLADGDATRLARLAQQARLLMMPGEMGERFKVMAWCRNLDVELSGFALRDFRHTL